MVARWCVILVGTCSNCTHFRSAELSESHQENKALKEKLQVALRNAELTGEVTKLRAALQEKEDEVALLQDTVARECSEREELVRSLEAAREQVLQYQRANGHLSMTSSRSSSSQKSSRVSSGALSVPPTSTTTRVAPLRPPEDNSTMNRSIATNRRQRFRK
eukprot:m.224006 g.224006  ORF g.224006 m.224006 type:complete len:162 (-) comp17028_c3_seq1:346-831(-)